MKSKLYSLLLMFGVIALVMTGCKKEDPDPISIPAATPKPSLAKKEQVVTVPTKLQTSSDSNAQTAVGYLNMMNSMTSYSSNFTIPSNAVRSTNKNSSETWTWSYGYGQYTYDFVYTFTTTSTQYIWDIKLGINGATPVQYMHAEENLNGTVGNMSIYYSAFNNYAGYDLSGYYWYYSWNVDANGYGTIYMEAHDGTNDVIKYAATINPDGSGEVSYYINNIIRYKLTWTASGTGSWYFYDETGLQTSTGTWQ